MKQFESDHMECLWKKNNFDIAKSVKTFVKQPTDHASEREQGRLPKVLYMRLYKPLRQKKVNCDRQTDRWTD